MAQFKELLVFGTARFFDEVYAKKFIGEFQGTVTNATNDALNQNIAETYIKSIADNHDVDETITITYGDGTTQTITTRNTQTEVVDDVVSTDTDKALSANQGKVLQEEIDDIETVMTWTSFDPVTP